MATIFITVTDLTSGKSQSGIVDADTWDITKGIATEEGGTVETEAAEAGSYEVVTIPGERPLEYRLYTPEA